MKLTRNRVFAAMPLLTLVMMPTIALAGAGGPDAFGYEWKDNNEVNGPALEWIDISSTGTLAAGLTDDNSIGPIPLPKPFHYYWQDVSSIKIGSNGWIGFENTGNIAHCFPSIPAQGGAADNYLAPLMSDLNFATTSGTPNPGSLRYYYDSGADLFIISYFDVPFWTNNVDSFDGASNTFQVVLDYSNNHIRFNYQRVDPFNNTTNCATEMSIGIEAPQGNIGLEHSVEVVPGTPLTIEFVPPLVPLISIIDPAPLAGIEPENRALIGWSDADLPISARIGNVGNGDGSQQVDVTAGIFNGGSGIYSDSVSESPMLAGETRDVVFGPLSSPPDGLSELRLTTVAADDINPSNNSISSEFLTLPAGAQSQTLSFTTATSPTGSISWSGSGSAGDYGMAVYFPGTGVPMQILQVGGVPLSDTCTTYRFQIEDDDGVNGLPGTILSSVDVVAASVSLNVWNDIPLDSPVLMDGSGFYAVWRQIDDCALGTVDEVPSRRNLELLAGTFAEFRDGSRLDPMLRVVAAPVDIFSDGLESTPP
ncbi:MAG: hypothetical protein H7A20_08125 [Rhodanobacteraceae bacterium]|nr:hypothetical protein [Rhodanobacteraceae bacterium]HPF72092.1 hypothetical protein [Xanthomonadaceae bacterium]HRX99178.1 hypothetical protein [Xanthomonadaceae bacterium]